MIHVNTGTPTVTRGDHATGAVFSPEPTATYRYALWRVWRQDDGHPLFIMLNPSTADHRTDDPTIRRCVRYALRWGYGGMAVCNLYAYRATNPRTLRQVTDPVGPENELFLLSHARVAQVVICAWGAHGGDRGLEVARWLGETLGRPLHALAFTAAGVPRHPLYLPGRLQPHAWNP